ncbi:unnamed protein product, partial [Ilex paraguariensis]
MQIATHMNSLVMLAKTLEKQHNSRTAEAKAADELVKRLSSQLTMASRVTNEVKDAKANAKEQATRLTECLRKATQNCEGVLGVRQAQGGYLRGLSNEYDALLIQGKETYPKEKHPKMDFDSFEPSGHHPHLIKRKRRLMLASQSG